MLWATWRKCCGCVLHVREACTGATLKEQFSFCSAPSFPFFLIFPPSYLVSPIPLKQKAWKKYINTNNCILTANRDGYFNCICTLCEGGKGGVGTSCQWVPQLQRVVSFLPHYWSETVHLCWCEEDGEGGLAVQRLQYDIQPSAVWQKASDTWFK